MRNTILVVLSIPLVLWANPISNISSWFEEEYKNFRVHPRVSRAYDLIQEGKTEEARSLLEKALEIDSDNQEAVDMLVNLCIQEKDKRCVERYADKTKNNSSLGYLYAYKAQEAKKADQYEKAITYAKKARTYKLKNKDLEFVNLLLFESYLAEQDYRQADRLIDRDKLITYDLLKWSKVSSNLGNNKYAYALALELPDKKEYVQWRVDLLLADKRYKEASSEMNKLYKMEPTDENLKQLVYLYDVTNQNKRLSRLYQNQLRRGCNAYALLYLLEYYKNNTAKQVQLLERNYPFSCLPQKKRMVLSQQLIHLLKQRKPSKAKRIANDIAHHLDNAQGKILLYQESGQEEKIVEVYQSTLQRGCDAYALNYLLDHYQNNAVKQKQILEENYPYGCLSSDKRVELTMQLVMLLDKNERSKIQPLLDQLEITQVDSQHYMNIANLYAHVEEYDKSKTYALAYLEKYPNDITALKSVGYTSFKLNDKEDALPYLLQAAKLDQKDHELLKNIGYLCVELGQPESAIAYWNRYLNIKEDSIIELEIALLYQNMEQYSNADKALVRYEAKAHPPHSSRYYLIKGKLASQKGDCPIALESYDKSLQLEQDTYARYEYAQLLKTCHEPKKALAILKELSRDYPKKLLYKKELAYLYEQRGEYDKAIENFQYVAQHEPNKVASYMALATVQKKAGNEESAVSSYKQAIDYATDVKPKRLQYIKQEITENSKRFNVYASQTARLDGDKGKGSYAQVPNALYDGFGFLEFSYQPQLLSDNTTLFANLIHDHNDFAKSAQPSIGIRYRPFKETNFYLSAQQMIKAGDATRNDTVVRASFGVANERKKSSDIYQNLYLDANYFIENKSKVFYGNYEAGKEYPVAKNMTLSPYITTGGSLSDDNMENKNITKLDAGVGIAFNMVSGETRYETGLYANRLKLEARRQYAGNSEDESTVRLQWEFFF